MKLVSIWLKVWNSKTPLKVHLAYSAIFERQNFSSKSMYSTYLNWTLASLKMIRIQKIVLFNGRIIVREIAKLFRFPYGSCEATFTNALNMNECSKLLNFQQKQQRAIIAEKTLNFSLTSLTTQSCSNALCLVTGKWIWLRYRNGDSIFSTFHLPNHLFRLRDLNHELGCNIHPIREIWLPLNYINSSIKQNFFSLESDSRNWIHLFDKRW